MNLLNNDLSTTIYQLRKNSGITQENLASRLGVSYQAVSKWENGQSFPDITLIPELADIFGVSIDTLFGRSEKYNDLREGLVLELLFDQNAQDSSGNGKHGRLIGGHFCKDRFGRDGKALAFNGKDDFVIIESPPLLNDKEFTLSLWCYYDAQTVFDGWHSAIISQDGHHQNRVFQLSTKDDCITFHRFLTEPDLTAKVIPEQWYHIAVSFKEKTYRLYINGDLAAEKKGQFNPNKNEPIYIGRKSTEDPSF